MAISDDDIARVRASSDIVALISEQVALKKVGRRWVGLCPFHTEKSGSFYVNAEEGRYHCFGCQVSGDQITWIRETQRVDFVDAVRQLADKAGIELHEDEHVGAQRKERQEFLNAMELAVQWYHEQLLNAPGARGAREYLRARGISGEVAREFRLGWAPDEWDALSSTLSLTPKVLEGTGLGFVNRVGRRQDALRARVIFPIMDPSGKPIAVGGRILPGAPPRPDGRDEAKYKNSPETAIYSKRRTLYGLNWAKEDIIKSGEIVVCEGYTDVIACFQSGIARAVATCGTALGEDHFRVMRNFARRIVLAYDADGAGQSAAASVYQWEKDYDVDVAVARLPVGMDPGELGQRDPEALRLAISGAIPFLQFRLERVLSSANVTTAEGRARAAQEAMAVLAEHPNELVRDQYMINVADRLRIEVAALRQSAQRRVTPSDVATARRPRRMSEALPRPGIEALRWMLNYPEDAGRRFGRELFLNETQAAIYQGLASKRSVSEIIDDFRRHGDDVAAQVLEELSVDELDRDYAEDEVSAVVAQLLRAAAGAELRNVDRDLRTGTLSPEEAMAVIRDVKERLELLETPRGRDVEDDVRRWLVSRRSEAT